MKKTLKFTYRKLESPIFTVITEWSLFDVIPFTCVLSKDEGDGITFTLNCADHVRAAQTRVF